MALTTSPRSVSYLRYEDRNGSVVVTPEDNDRFMITVEAAIRACQAYHQQAVFQLQFKQTLQKLGEWLRAHQQDVGEAYVTVRDAGLLFLVVRRQAEYDSQFEDDLTDLDMQIAQDTELNLIRLSVFAIPPCSHEGVNSFLLKDYLVYKHA